ncbi:hypothetical protein BaRGS_00003836 [Batillaria attramentaria]|uniref:Uncharacterized protein n=1 Tax=Batillaria attramentaria TaxID=370345 RepID=A0ABD0M0B0_9CAEN
MPAQDLSAQDLSAQDLSKTRYVRIEFFCTGLVRTEFLCPVCTSSVLSVLTAQQRRLAEFRRTSSLALTVPPSQSVSRPFILPPVFNRL